MTLMPAHGIVYIGQYYQDILYLFGQYVVFIYGLVHRLYGYAAALHFRLVYYTVRGRAGKSVKIIDHYIIVLRVGKHLANHVKKQFPGLGSRFVLASEILLYPYAVPVTVILAGGYLRWDGVIVLVLVG